MTFSYSLVLALFLLAPGFAVVAAIYTAGGPNRLEATPPPPNSVMALALVTGGALAAHALAAIFFAICHLIALVLGIAWSLPDPDPYLVAMALGTASPPIAAIGLAWILLLLVALSSGSFLLVRAILTGPLGQSEAIKAALYGWLHDLYRDDGAIAYVVTNLAVNNAVVGYEGAVEYVILDADRQVQTLVLADAQMFTLASPNRHGHVDRIEHPREIKLPLLTLKGSEIKNIVFDQIRFAPTPEGEPSDAQAD